MRPRAAAGPGAGRRRGTNTAGTAGRLKRAWRAAAPVGGAIAVIGAYLQSLAEKLLPSVPVWVYVAGTATFGIPAVWEKARKLFRTKGGGTR